MNAWQPFRMLLIVLACLGIGAAQTLGAGELIFKDGFEAFQCAPDRFEPNDSMEQAATVSPGHYPGLSLCPDDEFDYFRITIPAGAIVQASIQFSHAQSDLDLFLLAEGGSILTSSESSSDNESVIYQNSGGIPVDAFILATLISGVGAGYVMTISVD